MKYKLVIIFILFCFNANCQNTFTAFSNIFYGGLISANTNASFIIDDELVFSFITKNKPIHEKGKRLYLNKINQYAHLNTNPILIYFTENYYDCNGKINFINDRYKEGYDITKSFFWDSSALKAVKEYKNKKIISLNVLEYDENKNLHSWKQYFKNDKNLWRERKYEIFNEDSKIILTDKSYKYIEIYKNINSIEFYFPKAFGNVIRILFGKNNRIIGQLHGYYLKPGETIPKPDFDDDDEMSDFFNSLLLQKIKSNSPDNDSAIFQATHIELVDTVYDKKVMDSIINNSESLDRVICAIPDPYLKQASLTHGFTYDSIFYEIDFKEEKELKKENYTIVAHRKLYEHVPFLSDINVEAIKYQHYGSSMKPEFSTEKLKLDSTIIPQQVEYIDQNLNDHIIIKSPKYSVDSLEFFLNENKVLTLRSDGTDIYETSLLLANEEYLVIAYFKKGSDAFLYTKREYTYFQGNY